MRKPIAIVFKNDIKMIMKIKNTNFAYVFFGFV